jgi:toxin YoeB
MRTAFTPHGWDVYAHWQRTDRAMVKRVNRLIDNALRDPTSGIGKPEPLRHLLAGSSSRRISEEHRLVQLVDGDDLAFRQARHHYDEWPGTGSLPAPATCSSGGVRCAFAPNWGPRAASMRAPR